MTQNPLEPFLAAQGCVVLDGGLATELEARGHDLNDPLWSAKVLLEDPEAIREVHMDYLRAGADCITTATYQATLQGFGSRGLSEEEGASHLKRAVALAVGTRDQFWSEPANRKGRVRPLVAASVGPYGAFLANGSEYTGEYGLDKAALVDFHRARWGILAGAGADLLACETVPSAPETEALLELLGGTQSALDRQLGATGPWAWISFSCADGEHISDGTRLEEVVRLCQPSARLAAVGINCTSPAFVDSLIGEARRGGAKHVLVYPNSGEIYDAGSKTWCEDSRGEPEWPDAPRKWIDLGASGVGGCCRVGPDEIATLRLRLLG